MQLKIHNLLNFTIRKTFNLNFFDFKLIAPSRYNNIQPLVTYLCWVPNNTSLCLFSSTPRGACIIARAGGSCGYYLTSATFARTYAIIILPSGILKILSKFILTATALSEYASKKFIKHPSAGFFRRNGKHPNTRGIAMNATDHPHGGKTHTVASPVTP